MAITKSIKTMAGVKLRGKRNGIPSWLAESFPNKFEKRLREARDCELVRTTAREGMLGGCKGRYVLREEMNVAVEHYSTRVGTQHDTPRGWAPYDRTLVRVKPSYERTVYLPASWVRALHDGQWWIVVAYTSGRNSSPSNQSASALAHIDRAHFYKLMLMLVRQNATANLSAHLRTVDPLPRIWVSLEGADTVYPAGSMRLDPPEAGLPVLHVTVGKTIDCSAGVYLHREFRIWTEGSGQHAATHVRQFVYRGGWPRANVADDKLTHSNTDAKMVHNMLEFLHKVDEAQRNSPDSHGPILITQSTSPWLEEPKRPGEGSHRDPQSSTEGVNRPGTLMAALSLLRVCNFRNLGRFKKPRLSSTSLSEHTRKLEFTWRRPSPLRRVFNIGTGKSDKVLQEVNNLLDQCPYVLSAGVGGATSPAEGGGVSKQALWMIYFMISTEASGDPSPSATTSSASIRSNQAVRSFQIGSESGRTTPRAASPAPSAQGTLRARSSVRGSTSTLRARSHSPAAANSMGSQTSRYHTARGSMRSSVTPRAQSDERRASTSSARHSSLSIRNSAGESHIKEPAADSGSKFIEQLPTQKKASTQNSSAATHQKASTTTPQNSSTLQPVSNKRKGFIYKAPNKLLRIGKNRRD